MDKFTFGKYKGNSVDTIIETDPIYVLWVFKNVEFFTLTSRQKNRAETKKDIKLRKRAEHKRSQTGSDTALDHMIDSYGGFEMGEM